MRRHLVRALGRRDIGKVLAVSTVVATVLLSAAMAYAARPGGGSSYSGGSRSGGSSSRSSGGSSYSGGSHSGGSGDGDALGFAILLCFEHPVIGIPLLIIVIGVIVLRSRARSMMDGVEWSTAVASAQSTMTQPKPEPLRSRLNALRGTDPAFSVIVFEDFLYFLYAEMHRARGAAGAEALATYLGEGARQKLHNDGRIGEVTGIIIGAMSYEHVHVDSAGNANVSVIVESNYVERYRPQGEQRFYVKERLRLSRAAGAKSRTPDKARVLNCPNCGGPLSAMRGKVCSYCNTLVETGQKDWAITTIDVLEREPRGPLLTSSVEEQGTHFRTIVDPYAQASFGQIQAKDPEFSWQRLQHRVGLIFQEFHAGWVSRDPAKVRPFVSDNLFQSQLYWIDLYRSSKCINRTDGAAITNLELASATSDAYFDAVTVRLYATGLDYTISEDGRLLSGNKNKPRAYSEYWTLIRGAQKKKTDKGEKQCPNCGAPLQINMAGNCQYCAVKVTSGEYDWVLSRIEQDEAYTG